MDTNKLRGLVYTKYRSASEMARAIGWSKRKISRIITGKQPPAIKDIFALTEALDTPWPDIMAIFNPVPGAGANDN